MAGEGDNKGKGVAEAEAAGEGMVTLSTSDGQERHVPKAVMKLSRLIRGMIEVDPEPGSSTEIGGGIPLHNVDASTLDLVLEYCNKHAAAATTDSDPAAAAPTTDSDRAAAAAAADTKPAPAAAAGSSTAADTKPAPAAAAGSSTAASENLDAWDREFFDRLTLDALYHLLNAANYLVIDVLLDAICQKVADMMKGQTADQIRITFNITKDFSQEEEAALRQQYAWIYDE